jgi:DNA-binding MarR family transcriptional regulator
VAKPLNLAFDPIARAGDLWERRWGYSPAMLAVTSIMRAQAILIAELDALLRPYELTFARYEALVLLTFSRAGSLPLGKMGERLQVHPTSVTSIVDRLESAGLVVRRRRPDDRRGVLAEITPAGRAVVEAATADLVGARFAIADMDRGALRELSALLKPVREHAGDF